MNKTRNNKLVRIVAFSAVAALGAGGGFFSVNAQTLPGDGEGSCERNVCSLDTGDCFLHMNSSYKCKETSGSPGCEDEAC